MCGIEAEFVVNKQTYHADSHRPNHRGVGGPDHPPPDFVLRGGGPGVQLLVPVQSVGLPTVINCCHQSCSFWPRYAPNRLSAEASPQTPLGELSALPQTR